MNELIEKLAEQAGYTPLPGFDFANSLQEVFIAKFAELIMKECISVPYAMWDQAELNADVAVKIEHRIRDHFGIEQ